MGARDGILLMSGLPTGWRCAARRRNGAMRTAADTIVTTGNAGAAIDDARGCGHCCSRLPLYALRMP
jgi:hypothetical protein